MSIGDFCLLDTSSWLSFVPISQTMPERNVVPSLKLISTRKVAWPDGVDRKDIDVYPCAEQYCRDTIYRPYISENLPKLQKWIGTGQLKDTSNTLLSRWIQISNYYESTLADFNHMELFFKLHPPEFLDFLHERFTLPKESDQAKFLQFVSVVPKTSITQGVNITEWKAIVDILTTNQALLSVKEICIRFGDADDSPTPNPSEKPRSSLTLRLSSPELTPNLEGFHTLTKLVVRGKADDSFMQSVGVNCYHLKYLDISRSHATIEGVRLIFYKDTTAEKGYIKAYTAALPWNLPKYLLRPLTKTLEYFEMSDMPLVRYTIQFQDAIKMACPQLVATPNQFFFRPGGQIKIICKEFNSSPTFVALRQLLVLHVRSMFCEDIFCFVRGFLACTHAISPTFEVRVDEVGYEVGFLLFSEDLLLAYCELENLTVVNFTSYTKSTCQFIPIDLLGHLAPNLQRIKAPLKGTVSEKYPLRSVQYVAMPMVYNIETFRSIVQKCPKLQYLEVKEMLFHPTPVQNGDIQDIFERTAKNLEILRILFDNQITLVHGLTTVIGNCPSLKMVGDLKSWAVSEKSFFRLHKQLAFHNFRIAIEYNGIIYHNESAERQARYLDNQIV